MNSDDLPADTNPRDGLPPTFDRIPVQRSIDPASFETIGVRGVDVPLAPIEAVYSWYARREARVADARGSAAYQRSHIYGAVSSPASDGESNPDPVASWPKDDRIVTYCGCPHHLSSLRAATLIKNGYETVYALDEGFWEWHDRGYPMAGREIPER